jgi:hypothetical protein
MSNFSAILWREQVTFDEQKTVYAVDHGFEPWSDKTKDYEISISCFSSKHTALKRKSKDWSTRNQNNVSQNLPTDCCFSEQAL